MEMFSIYHILCIALIILVIIQWFIIQRVYIRHIRYKELEKIRRLLNIGINEEFTILDEKDKELINNPFYFTENELIDSNLKKRKDLIIPLTVGKYKIKR